MRQFILHRAVLAVLGAAISFLPVDRAAALSPEEIRAGYLRHAAMAQAFRWYQYYENGAVGMKNQLDILEPDITLKSALGEARGHAAYSERTAKLPSSWKNAHFIRKNAITVAPDGTLRMQLEITYLNQGMLPDGVVRTAELAYNTVLKRGTGLLPRFQTIEITQKSEGAAAEFKPAYAENRLLGLVHYWLALIEDPSRNPEPAREILSDGFSLNFPSGAITTFDGFKAWLAGTGSQVTASTHAICNFSFNQTGVNEYALSVDFDWEGIMPNATQALATTRHRWVVVDNPAERFARIKSLNVEILKPFRPKP